MLVGRRPQHPAVGRDHLGGDQVVDAQAELAGQPPHAAAQGEPPTPVWLTSPAGHGQAVGLGSRVQVGQQSARRRPRARRAAGSTVTAFSRLRSIIRPSSHTAVPAVLCAPPRTDISSWCSRA